MTEQQWERTLDELLRAESGLTDWDIGFIDSMDKLRGRTPPCSTTVQESSDDDNDR